MGGKAERTQQYILEKVAPVFNRLGYAGTSMSDITAATGLTKGAVYGNFRDKEDLAVQAFNFNIRRTVGQISAYMNEGADARAKLARLTDFYRHYIETTRESGGCPILNIGVDANHRNPALLARVQSVTAKLIRGIASVVEEGQAEGSIRPEADAEGMARSIFAMIQGAVFMAFTLQDQNYLNEIMDRIDALVASESLT